jgi:hypothetical protein
MTSNRNGPKGLLVFAVVVTLFALGTIAFWAVFFTAGLVSASDRPAYLEHEKSFPLADAYAVVCAFLCVAGVIKRKSWAVLFGVAAGSGIIFLGLMDTLYALEQGLIRDLSFPSIETFLICSICLALGPVMIIYMWWNREYFL